MLLSSILMLQFWGKNSHHCLAVFPCILMSLKSLSLLDFFFLFYSNKNCNNQKMKTNRNKGISMDLPPHTRYKRGHFFIFLTSCLGLLPSRWEKGTPSHSFLSEQFENPGVYTIQENWSIQFMVTTMRCSLLKPPALSRAR